MQMVVLQIQPSMLMVLLHTVQHVAMAIAVLQVVFRILRMATKKYYVKDLKKTNPDKPSNCLRCALFMDSDNYKVKYTLFHSPVGNEPEAKILIVLKDGTQRDVADSILKDYVYRWYSECAVYITYAIKCFPITDKDIKIAAVHEKECSEFLQDDIDKLKPDHVIVMGSVAKNTNKYREEKEKENERQII